MKHSVEAASGTPLPDAVVLAGGLGTRLGGADKGLLEVAGEPLAVRVAALLRPYCAQLWVAARSQAGVHYARLGLAALDDGAYAGAGPLAGMLAAMRASRATWLVTAPCDTPLLPADYVTRLLGSAASAATPVVVAATGAQREHFACAALRVDLAPGLHGYLRRGGRRVEDFYRQVGYTPVDFRGQADAFLNINTPADLARAQHTLESATLR